MGMFRDLVTSVRTAFSPEVETRGLDFGLSGYDALMNSGPIVREPFSGAWQKNMEQGSRSSILSMSAVFTCISIIAMDISKLPLRVMQVGSDGGATQFTNHPASILLRKPNPNQTTLQFIQQWLTSKLTSGNAYVLLFRDARGVVNEMYVLDPSRVKVLVSDDGGVYYQLKADNLTGVFKDGVIFPQRDIIHDRMPAMGHPLIGTSPLFAAGYAARMGLSISTNSETFFTNMSRPSGVISGPNKIDPKVAADMMSRWEQNYSKGGVGRTAVLGSGLGWTQLQMNAADAQLIDQLKWTIQDVSRVFRVPGFMLGELDRTTYRNSEQMARTYYNGALAHHVESIEACLDDKLGLDGINIYTSFDFNALFRAESDVRAQYYASMIDSGIMAINEARIAEGLPRVKGGEEPRVQVQYVPLSLATGEGVSQPGAPAPGTTPAPAPSPAPTPAPSPAPTPAPTSAPKKNDDATIAPVFDSDSARIAAAEFIKSLNEAIDA